MHVVVYCRHKQHVRKRCLWHKRQTCAGMAGKSAEVGATASKAQLKLGRIRHFKRTGQYCSPCFSSVIKKRAEILKHLRGKTIIILDLL